MTLEEMLRQAREARQPKESFDIVQEAKGLGTAALAGAGFGLMFGGPVGGAILGGLSYVVDRITTETLKSAGLDEDLAEMAGLGLSILTPGGLASKANKLFVIPTKFEKIAKLAGAGISAGYLGYSIPDNDDQALQVGILGVPIGVGLEALMVYKGLGDAIIRKAGPALRKIEGSSYVGGIKPIEVKKPIEKTGLRPGFYDIVKESAEKASLPASGIQALYDDIAGQLYHAGVKPGSPISEKLSIKAREGKIIPQFIKDEKIRSSLEAIINVDKQLKEIFIESGFANPHALDMYTKRYRSMWKLYMPAIMLEKESVTADLTTKPFFKRVASDKIRSRATLIRGKIKNLPKSAKGKFKPGDIYVDEEGLEWVVFKHGRKIKMGRDWTVDEALEKGWLPDLASEVAIAAREQSKLVRKALTLKWVAEQGAELGLVSDSKVEGFQYIKNTSRSGIFYDHGALGGKWVHPQVAEAVKSYLAIEDYSKNLGPVIKSLARINSMWKKLFLGLNMKSYVNATVGNILLSALNGYNPAEVIEYAIKANPGTRRLAKTFGIGIEDYMLDAIRATPVATKLPEELQITNAIDKIFGAVDRLGDKAINFYGKVDQVFKLGLFSKLIDEGMDITEAANVANKAFVHYALLPVNVTKARDTLIPFISFFYRAIPMLGELAIRHPHRALVLGAEIQLLQEAAYREQYGKKWRKGRKFENLASPSYAKTHIGGIFADYIRVPKIGPFPGGLMSAALMPWNLPFSVPDKEYGSLAAFIVNQSPVIRFLSGVIVGADPSTGRDVYRMAGPNAPIRGVGAFAAKQLMPNYTSIKAIGNWIAKEGMFDPLVAFFNFHGVDIAKEGVDGWNTLWNIALPAIRRINPEYQYEMAYYRIMAAIQEHQRALSKARFKGGALPVLEKHQRALLEAKEKAAEQLRNLNEAYLAAD